MRIEIITIWYNEEKLAPFFLNHYKYVDKIHLLLDADTNDDTRKICSGYSNVEIEDFTFPDMMDDILKVNKINETVNKLDCDWVYVLDSDEFIWPSTNEDPKRFLSKQKDNLLYAKIYQVYRHITESNLNINYSIQRQRCHGDPNITKGINAAYNKPIVFKPQTNVILKPGNHSYQANNNITISKDNFIGAHWAMADVDMAIKRRIAGRKERQSKRNLAMGMTMQHHHVTEEEIKHECNSHLLDPKLW